MCGSFKTLQRQCVFKQKYSPAFSLAVSRGAAPNHTLALQSQTVCVEPWAVDTSARCARCLCGRLSGPQALGGILRCER